MRGHWIPVLVALLLCACRSTVLPAAARGPDAYAVRIEGNRNLSDTALLRTIADNLVDFERSDHGKAAIDDAAFVLEQHYRDSGFHRATVEYEVLDEQREVRLLVKEGPRIELEHVALRGMSAIQAAELRRVIEALGSETDWYSEARLARAATAIEARYRTIGYQDVRVEVTEVVITDEGATATLLIDEGPAYRLNAVFFSGELVFEEQELMALLAPDMGSPYTPRRAARMLGRIETYYADRGFPDAKVELAELERGADGAVNLAMNLMPGTRVTLGPIRIEGATKTREAFIRERLTIEPGQRYSYATERESFRGLYSTGLFSRIEFELEGDGELRPVVVHVVEDRGLELFAEPGWGSYDRLRLRSGIRERNLFGTGRLGRLEGLYSERTGSAQAGITNPWFWDSRFIADASLTYTRREEPSFEFEDTELDLTLLNRWGTGDSASLTYRFRRSDLIAEDITAAPLVNISNDVDVSAIRVGRLRDTRDQVIVPSDGHRVELTFEWAGSAIGSETDFLRGTASFAGYHRLGDRTILAGSFRTGLIAPIADTDQIPLQERFFNGGENTVRSYSESELGPVDSSGEPIGGEAFSVLSLELRRQLRGRIEGAFFVDAGNVAAEVSDYLNFDDVGFAVGVGLRYVLPVGPLRLDLGVNPDPEDGEDDYVLHFSLGRPF